jgi:beta-glucosidase
MELNWSNLGDVLSPTKIAKATILPQHEVVKSTSSFLSFLKVGLLLMAALIGAPSLSRLVADPATTIPADNPIPHQQGWLKECDDRIAAAKGNPVDIIFLGDSITQNFIESPKPSWNLVGASVWQEHYGTRNVLNLGVGSDGTEHILWRMDHEDIKDFTPKVIVLLAGLNDLQYSAPDIAAGIKAILDKCHTMYPMARIILVSIPPNGRNMSTTNDANKLIQAFADNQNIFYLDLGPSMPPVGDSYKGIGFDHIHFTNDGYENWATQLDPLLDKLLH